MGENVHCFTPEPIRFIPPPLQRRDEPRIPRRQEPVHVPLLSLPEPIFHPMPTRGHESDGPVDIDAIPDRGLETNDEYDGGDWDSDHLDDGDKEEDVPPFPRENTLPIRGRTDKHPVQCFNEISAFVEADIAYFGRRITYDSELAPGQYFKSKLELSKKINEHHITNNQEIRMKKSDQSRMHVVCNDPSCRFELRAKATGQGQTWEITKQDKPHTCRSASSRTDHAQLTASIIADIIEETIKKDPCISIQGVANCVRIKYNHVIPKYNRLWRGRELAIARQFGSWECSYSLLEPLLQAICHYNPGSKYEMLTTPVEVENARLFKSVAWAYAPCIAAVPFLRPVISIDACFMSGRYEGRLYIACGYDAENQLLPLAFALVQKEDGESWAWFMRWLRNEVLGPTRFMCVISDQHKGIKYVFDHPEISGWEPGTYVHRLCMQHVADNLVNNTGKERWIGDRFKQGCKKKKPRRLREMFAEFAEACPKANVYLRKVGKKDPNDVNEPSAYEKIFQTTEGGFRWGIMTTNGSESLNNVFKKSRRLPVAAVVEDTFYKCNAWFVDRRQNALQLMEKNQKWATRVELKLAKHRKKAGAMNLVPYTHGHGVYQVSSPKEYVPVRRGPDGLMDVIHREFQYIVTHHDDDTIECTCRGIQLTGIPCSHVLEVCRVRNWDENRFVAGRYGVDHLLATWNTSFQPYRNQEDWPPYLGVRVFPSRSWIRVGRRKHNRFNMTMDEMQGRQRGHTARRSTSDRRRAGM